MTPHPDRLPCEHPRFEEILRLHEAAVDAHQPGYIDPDSGLFVLTAAYHLERGSCCHNGCRHCPFLEG